jgi:predicted N-acyltransferase
VFDWSWADAYDRAGLNYYPKLVSSIPFTPATGPRLLLEPGLPANKLAETLIRAARRSASDAGASSVHVLFPNDSERQWLAGEGFLCRKSCQFHWHNAGYASFDDFLSRFSSAKRKKARRERRRIEEAGIVFEQLRGDEPSAGDWDAIFEFYSRTFLRRGRPPYLNRDLFDEVVRTMPENLVIMLARYEGQPIAAAICFRGGDSLYGRYWGSLADFHSLHFETCYYQGIDYCIREGLMRFEPGTQGEHKISRGFSPTATWSCHWLDNPTFHAAVEEFLARETSHVDSYMEHAAAHVPYRRESLGNEAG